MEPKPMKPNLTSPRKKACCRSGFVALMVLVMVTPSWGQWAEVDSGTTQFLSAVQMRSNSTGWAVGVGGTILRTLDAGATWSPQTSGTNAILNKVNFVDLATGWVVGSSGLIRKTTNGGDSWTAQASGTTQTLSAVHFFNSSIGWVVGDEGTILKTTNGGSSWVAQTAGTIQALYGVCFVNAITGWVVGNSGVIFKTIDGGTTWVSQRPTPTENWRGVHFADASTGWVVGLNGKARRTTDGGVTWVPQKVATAGGLFDVDFVDANQGWIVGDSGRVFTTKNGGGKWTPQKSGTSESLVGVSFVSPGVGVAVGWNGKVTRYFEGSLLGKAFLTGFAKKGGAVLDLADTTFSSFGAAYVYPNGSALFEAKLAGKGASGGRNQAMMSGPSGAVGVAVRSREPLDGVYAGFDGKVSGRPFGPLTNRAQGLYQLPISGSFVTSRNNLVFIKDAGMASAPFGRKGSTPAQLEGAELSRYLEVLQSRDVDAVAVSYALRRDGAIPVTAANDSGLLLMNHEGTVLSAGAREGKPAFGGGGTFGQLVGRAAARQGAVVHFGASWLPDGQRKAVPGIFHSNTNGTVTGRTVSQGTEALGAGGPLFRTFVGWSQSGTAGLYRATLTGGGVKAADNEGIWRDSTLWLRKGVTDVGGGLVAKRLVRFWPVGTDQMVVQVLLGGAGVNSRNNQALLLRQANGTFLTLLRSGQTAPSVPEATVAKIQAVEVNAAFGHYVILGSLRGVAAGNNQVLWSGFTTAGNDTNLQAQRLPGGLVRKSASYESNLTPSGRIRSIGFKPAVDRSGAGARGLGQVISFGGSNVIFTVTGDAKVTELVRISWM